MIVLLNELGTMNYFPTANIKRIDIYTVTPQQSHFLSYRFGFLTFPFFLLLCQTVAVSIPLAVLMDYCTRIPKHRAIPGLVELGELLDRLVDKMAPGELSPRQGHLASQHGRPDTVLDVVSVIKVRVQNPFHVYASPCLFFSVVHCTDRIASN